MADPSKEYAKNMTKYTEDLDPETGGSMGRMAKRPLTKRQKGHKFNRMKKMKQENPSKRKKGSEGTGSYYGKASKRGRAYLRDLEEAGKI